MEKSKRSPRPELAVLERGAGETPGAESKAPKPLEELNPRVGCGAGGDLWTGFASKKLPPLRAGGEVCEGARWWEEMLPRPEKADCFGGACTGGDLGAVKLRLLNASFIPPNCVCCGGGDCCIGDCMPPKDPVDTWEGCCWGCGRGAEA